jgi:hypothetical protein
MNFCVMELGLTRNYVGDRLLVVIDDIAYTVRRINQVSHVGETTEALVTMPWDAAGSLFPWLEEQDPGDAYRRHPWLRTFLEEHVQDLFRTVPDGMIIGIPPIQPPGNDPTWTFYGAGAKVLTSDYHRGKLIKNGRSHKVHYERFLDRGIGEIHQTGWYVWTNVNGAVKSEDIPDTR